MNTLLVTGAAGFIGSNFTRLALSEGYRVVALDSLTYAGHKENLEGLTSNFEFIKEDIRSPEVGKILHKFKPTAVVNFAAESHVDRSISNPLLFLDTNITGTGNLLKYSTDFWNEAGRPSSFRFIQISTDEVYGSLGDTGYFSEHTPINPSSPYSASKASGDLVVQAWNHTYKIPTLITRCSNNYGPYQFPEKLIPRMIDCAISNKSLPIYGEGKNIRDWIHVSDHCRGILLSIEKGKSGSVYCFGGRSEIKNLDLVNAICIELDRMKPRSDGKSYKSQISFVTDRLGHDYRYAIDDSFAESQLGFKRQHSLIEGIRATVEWYLSNQDWVAKVKSKLERDI